MTWAGFVLTVLVSTFMPWSIYFGLPEQQLYYVETLVWIPAFLFLADGLLRIKTVMKKLSNC